MFIVQTTSIDFPLRLMNFSFNILYLNLQAKYEELGISVKFIILWTTRMRGVSFFTIMHIKSKQT